MVNNNIEHILKTTAKPARYIGGELNSVIKTDCKINFAFAFPDTYEVGMSHLGMKILYGLLNSMEDVYCQRVFAPETDMAAQLKRNKIKLFSLEQRRDLNKFDFVGFSLQYELCMTTVLYMLDLGGIPLKSSERSESDPIIIAGGPCCVNPEPFKDFFDIIVVGEAEETLTQLIELYKQHPDRKEYLNRAKKIQGVYIPKYYNQGETVQRALIKNMDTVYFPDKVIVPFIEPVHDRLMLEIMRGCPRGCRFCQAGFIYRPVRAKKVNTLIKQAEALIDSTGYEEISLTSLSATDYFGLKSLIDDIIQKYSSQRIAVSLPSLRIDKSNIDIMKQLRKHRPGALTFAPEAGSQRMRDIINKNVTEKDILDTLAKAFSEGFTKIKLYFMFGLPYETDEDIWAIGKLVKKILDLYNSNENKIKALNLTVSASCFVPKPHTPFQFFAQCTQEEIIHKTQLLQKAIPRRVKLNYNDSTLSALEAAFARGDHRLNDVILAAYKKGCIFDAWPEHYDDEKWKSAFSDCGLTIEDFALKNFDYEDTLPWDFIDIHVDKNFFIKEAKKSAEQKTTKNCYESCSGCGIQRLNGGCVFEI